MKARLDFELVIDNEIFFVQKYIYFILAMDFAFFISILAICFSLMYFLASSHSRSIHQISPPLELFCAFCWISKILAEAASKAASAATIAASATFCASSASCARASAALASSSACWAVVTNIYYDKEYY